MTAQLLTMVVLANSYKNLARCIAGIDLNSKEWIRPVGDIGQGELSEGQAHVKLSDGRSRPAAVGDVVEVEIGKSADVFWHPEDRYLFGSMRLKMTIPNSELIKELRPVITRGGAVLGDFQTRIPIEEVRTRSNLQSLQLIEVSELRCSWRLGNRARQPQLRGSFTLAGKELDLSITDVAFNNSSSRNRMPFTIESPVLTMSLGSPFRPSRSENEYCYKLIAGVIQQN